MQNWDLASRSWILSKGTFKVFVGTSSRDLELQETIEVM